MMSPEVRPPRLSPNRIRLQGTTSTQQIPLSRLVNGNAIRPQYDRLLIILCSLGLSLPSSLEVCLPTGPSYCRALRCLGVDLLSSHTDASN